MSVALGVGALALSAFAFALAPAVASGSVKPYIPNNGPQPAHILLSVHPADTVYTANWAGVAATGDTFTSVSATYSVPAVDCSVTSNAFAYHWIGLDGFNNSAIEQDGVAGFCTHGEPTYSAWLEMYPAGIDSRFTVNPGDAIHASVSYSAVSGLYTLALTDVTTGESFSQPEACPNICERSSAEVISEGYPVENTYDGTADYGIENYENITVTDQAGNTGGFTPFSRWAYAKIIQKGVSIDAEPSAIYGGQAFSNTWLAEF
jgi:hypothetical protein